MTLLAVALGALLGLLVSGYVIRRDKARTGRRMLGWASRLPLAKPDGRDTTLIVEDHRNDVLIRAHNAAYTTACGVASPTGPEVTCTRPRGHAGDHSDGRLGHWPRITQAIDPPRE